ncbi:hypothetical protein EBU99_09020 [bacterium]|nr:hypothetical protein [bacterium]
MSKISTLFAFAGLALVACQTQQASLDSKKKDPSKLPPTSPLLSMSDLKKKDGTLNCSGYDGKMNYISTSVAFKNGKVAEALVAGYEKKDKSASNVDLTKSENRVEIFKNAIKFIDVDVDLDGKKTSVELTAVQTDKARKIYSLDLEYKDGGEGVVDLAGYLSYKEISLTMDLSEVFMTCLVLPTELAK